MQLYYYRDPVGNFGDDLNPWLWPKLLPRPLEQCFDEDTLFIGVGSLLNEKVPAYPACKVVFGSGCGYGAPPKLTDAWRIYCVRGPLTAQALGLSSLQVISDSGLLVRTQVAPSGRPARHRAAFMPHHLTHAYDRWQEVCDALGICYLDPTAPVEATLHAIRDSGVVITEAMHGAIAADALRVPWIPVRTRPRISSFKWTDWSESVGITHRFEWVPPAWSADIDWRTKRAVRSVVTRVARERLRWLVRFGHRRLSADVVFDDVYGRLHASLQELIEAAATRDVATA